MRTNSTPLTAFHDTIRAILDDDDQETHTAHKPNEKIKAVLRRGEIRGYKLSADQSSVEPALTPESNQKAFTLLVAGLRAMRSQLETIDKALRGMPRRNSNSDNGATSMIQLRHTNGSVLLRPVVMKWQI